MRQAATLGLILAALASSLCGADVPSSDYDRDLADVNRRLAQVRSQSTGSRSISAQAAVLAEKALLTENCTDLVQARDAVQNVLAGVDPAPAFVALQAKLLLQLHQIEAAERAVGWLETHAPRHADSVGLRIDLLIEAGKFSEAQALCEAGLKRRREWPMLARLARVNTLLGRYKKADALYLEAEDTLTAKQMRVFAWLEVQRGRGAASQGRWDQAESHYARAEQAYSGLWLVAGCRAEAAAAQGDYALGVALYEALIERTDRPELCQTLGELYRFSDDPVRAKAWHERALAGYHDSADRGEVIYYHHLADFYADLRGDGEAAVTWARRDFARRPGPRTRQTLAWALYRVGAVSEALTEITVVLSTGLQNAHLFEQAARINLAAGRKKQSEQLLEKASSLNLNYKAFHVHF